MTLEVRGHFVRVSSPPPPLALGGSWGLNTCHYTWGQVPLLAAPSCQSIIDLSCICFFFFHVLVCIRVSCSPGWSTRYSLCTLGWHWLSDPPASMSHICSTKIIGRGHITGYWLSVSVWARMYVLKHTLWCACGTQRNRREACLFFHHGGLGIELQSSGLGGRPFSLPQPLPPLLRQGLIESSWPWTPY